MAVNGGHAGTKKGPHWGHLTENRSDFSATFGFDSPGGGGGRFSVISAEKLAILRFAI